MDQSTQHYTAKDLKELHFMTKDLLKVSHVTFWTDLVVTAVLAWGCLYLSLTSQAGSFQQIFYFLAAAVSFYKGVNFVHDISHAEKELGHFKTAYNLFFGLYTRVPAYIGGSHRDHHSSAKFGTTQDPEYVPWAHRHEMNVFRPLIASFISPFLVFIRMVLMTPAYLIAGETLQRKIYARASSVIMNFSYERSPNSDKDLEEMMESDVLCFAWAVGAIAIWAMYDFSMTAFLIYYGTLVISNALGSFRALANHRYYSNYAKQPAHGQFFDSVSIINGIFIPLWAPLHSNFHSIHHLMPHMPYHSMPEVHKRLMAHPTWSKIYGTTLENTIFSSLKSLYHRARHNRLSAPALNESKVQGAVSMNQKSIHG
jgi:fatty acid desaturase